MCLKKIQIIFLFLFLSSSLWAIDYSADINFTVPMSAWKENISLNDVSTRFDAGIGFDVSVTAVLNNSVSLKADAGFGFPNHYSFKTVTKKSNGEISTLKGNASYDYNSFFSFDLFLGASFDIKKEKQYSVFIAPGLYTQFFNCRLNLPLLNTKDRYHWINFGIGTQIGGTYNFTDKIYASFVCPLVFLINAKSEEKFYDVKKFFFEPKIGAGYRF